MRTLLYTLAFLLMLSSCNKDDIPAPDAKLNNNLANTTWVVTRYDHAMASQPTYVSDTIHFINKKRYTINNLELERTYYLTGDNTKSLKMYSFTTLGSDFRATLDKFIIEDGEINSTIFNDMQVADSLGHGYVLVWMHRID